MTRSHKALGSCVQLVRRRHPGGARWLTFLLALAASLMFGVSAASAAPNITGTWTCCGTTSTGTTQAGAQVFAITESGSGALSGSGLTPSGSVFSTITGSVSGGTATIVTTYNMNDDPGYVATFTGTIAADGSTMSGSWSSTFNGQATGQEGTWTATQKRKSATQVNCYDTSPGTPTDFFQCTAAVGDASGQATAATPTGTVAFTINPGGGGGFQGSSTCQLAPSQTGGPVGFCAVNYVPPAGGIPVGSQPPVTATYSGDTVFGISSGQPLTLQAAEQQVCANVYEPDCAGIVALPADLADECVTLDPSCTPGAQGDGGEDVSISDDQSSLVVKTSNPTLTPEEWQAYLQGNAGPDLTAKVQYILNSNTYSNAVNLDRSTILQSMQDYLQKGTTLGGYSSQTFNAASVIYTDQINRAYDQLATVGAQSTELTTTLNDAWCKGAADVAGCKENVAAIQMAINNSISTLANQKAKLGIDTPYVPPPSHGLFMPMLAQAVGASKKPKKPTHLSSIVLGSIKRVTLAPGQTKTVHMPIPASVRAELKQLLGKKSKRTLHATLIVQIVANGSYTTRTIPVTIHLTRAKQKKH